MPILPRKAALAVAAVIDVALESPARPLTAKFLSTRYSLPPRHLEPLLQALVRQGILRGVRGPRGGYELARERSRITVDEILRAADSAEEINGVPFAHSKLLKQIVMPALGQVERACAQALARINLDDLARSAERLDKSSQ